MTQAFIRYWVVHLRGDKHEQRGGSVGWILDDLLGILLDTEENIVERLVPLQVRYGPVGLIEKPLGPETVMRLRRRILKWRREGVPSSLLKACKKASEGHLDPWLAPHLARVKFGRGSGVDELPDMLAAAAWALAVAVYAGQYQVKKCAYCGLPWFTSGRGRYCGRILPGTLGQTTCLDAGKLRDHRARKREELNSG